MTQRANGVWYYQRRIPKASQPFLHKSYFKLSLRTSSKSEAMRKARELAVKHDKLFDEHHSISLSAAPLSQPIEAYDLESLQARTQLLGKLSNYAAKTIVHTQQLLSERATTRSEIEATYTGLGEIRDNFVELANDLVEERVSVVDAKTHRIWGHMEGALSDDLYVQFEALCGNEQRKVFIETSNQLRNWLSQLIQKLIDPMSDVELPLPPHEEAGTTNTSSHSTLLTPKTEVGRKLSECVSLFLAAKKQDEIQEKTFHRYVARTELMVRILGDVPINSLKREDALKFKDTVLKLPKNMNKVAKYRSKSIEEILAMEPEPMSTTTANDTFTDVSGFFKWCVDNDMTDKSSFEKLKVKQKKQASKQRPPFVLSDLSELFSQDTYTTKKPKHAHYYWLPILALYTGARLNELCQLYKDDIKLEDETWTITFTDHRDDQKLKNISSQRTIPMHSRLVELGFPDYLHSVSHERVFPALKLQRDGYQTAASKWFARYKDKVLPAAKEQGKVFHSFRHTVTDVLKQKGLQCSKVAAVLGHGEDNETFGRYGKAYVMDVLVPVIEQLKFELDITPWDNLK